MLLSLTINSSATACQHHFSYSRVSGGGVKDVEGTSNGCLNCRFIGNNRPRAGNMKNVRTTLNYSEINRFTIRKMSNFNFVGKLKFVLEKHLTRFISSLVEWNLTNFLKWVRCYSQKYFFFFKYFLNSLWPIFFIHQICLYQLQMSVCILHRR